MWDRCLRYVRFFDLRPPTGLNVSGLVRGDCHVPRDAIEIAEGLKDAAPGGTPAGRSPRYLNVIDANNWHPRRIKRAILKAVEEGWIEIDETIEGAFPTYRRVV